jgi:hypothetical protein
MICPDEVLRHPVAIEIVEKIKTERCVIVWGPSGGGKSMFVQAYMDKYVTPRGSVRKMLDFSTTPSELIEEDQAVREGSYGFVFVDGILWTKTSIRFFFNKIPSKTKIVLVLPVHPKNIQEYSAFPNVFVPQSIHPKATYDFLRSTSSLPYFPQANPRAFYEDYLSTRGVLARLLSKYMHGCAFMDEDVYETDVWSTRSLEDAVQYVSRRVAATKSKGENHPFVSLCGENIRLLADALETVSLVDVQYLDIYGDECARRNLHDLLMGSQVFRVLKDGGFV